MQNTIKIGTTFKLKVSGYSNQMLMTAIRIENDTIHYTAGKFGEGSLTIGQAENFDKLGLLKIISQPQIIADLTLLRKPCGCFYTKDGEINTPCAEHVERFLSAIEELEVETMFAGKFN